MNKMNRTWGEPPYLKKSGGPWPAYEIIHQAINIM